MVKKIREKSDEQCNYYKSAEDVSDPKELSPEKKV